MMIQPSRYINIPSVPEFNDLCHGMECSFHNTHKPLMYPIITIKVRNNTNNTPQLQCYFLEGQYYTKQKKV